MGSFKFSVYGDTCLVAIIFPSTTKSLHGFGQKASLLSCSLTFHPGFLEWIRALKVNSVKIFQVISNYFYEDIYFRLIFWNYRNKALYYLDFQTNLCSILVLYDKFVKHKALHRTLSHFLTFRTDSMYSHPEERSSQSQNWSFYSY